jgi:hypothetical protein
LQRDHRWYDPEQQVSKKRRDPQKRKERGNPNLDGIKPKPTSINLIDNPFTPLDEVVADLWVTVLDIRSH